MSTRSQGVPAFVTKTNKQRGLFEGSLSVSRSVSVGHAAPNAVHYFSYGIFRNMRLSRPTLSSPVPINTTPISKRSSYIVWFVPPHKRLQKTYGRPRRTVHIFVRPLDHSFLYNLLFWIKNSEWQTIYNAYLYISLLYLN